MSGAKVGTLAINSRGTIHFQYDQEWLRGGFDIAPYDIEFSAQLQTARANLFGGLHGVFNDSLPDGWGLLLMDRALKQILGWDRSSITPLDRLAYMGPRCMGALEYKPDLVEFDDTVPDIVALARSAEKVLDGTDDSVLPQLLIHGGSPGGARPKVTVARMPADRHCMSGFQPLQPGFEHWMVKFGAKQDPSDMGRVECAYATLASLAGLEMPKTELIDPGSEAGGDRYFAVKRFDRRGDVRIHMLSLCGHLYASHRAPTMDYEGILAATHRITGSSAEVAKAFRLMAFNVLACNRDDHTKNFAYLYDDGKWVLSAPFDLTQSDGIGGQHTSAINGSGIPSRKDVLTVASNAGVAHAEEILEEVVCAVARWPHIASKFGVGSERVESIGSAMEEVRLKVARAIQPERHGG